MSRDVRRFEDLRIWQDARRFANGVYDASRAIRDFEFRDQLQAAALSIINNIAEGFERGTDADFARFLDVAKGSSGESRSMLYLAEDRLYVTAEIAQRLREDAVALSKGITKLAQYLRTSQAQSNTRKSRASSHSTCNLRGESSGPQRSNCSPSSREPRLSTANL